MKLQYFIPLIAYFMGAIPFGYLLVKAQGSDIRSVGSGNIGATNVFRKSRWAGILTLVLDAAKGYFAVLVAGWMADDLVWQCVAAVCAILGHIFTPFLGFKGGKGVAAGCGAFLALIPLPTATTLIVFALVMAMTRYVSLASILAAAAFPVLAYLFREPLSVIVSAAIGSALIVAKHHGNIRRLVSGTEHKFALGNRP